MRFSRDRRGQSVVVGTVILFGFLIVALGVYQVQVVPTDNANVEFEHSQSVEGDFGDLRNDILRAGSTGSTGSTQVQLGTRYPTRTFFINPPPASGSIETEATGSIRVRNATIGEGAHPNVGRFWNTTPTFPTRSLRYDADYNELDDTPELVYEHSVVAAEFDDAVLLRTGQTVVSDDRISLTALTGSVSQSGVEPRSVDPRAVSASGTTVPLEPIDGRITLELPTAVEDAAALAERWNDSLPPNATARNVTGNVQITLANGSDLPYRLALSEVSVDASGETEPAYVVPVGPESATTGETVTVEVRDRYNNPVPDATVIFEGTTDDINITNETDDNGRVYFNANANGLLNASINGTNGPDYESISFDISEDGGRATGNRTFNVNWDFSNITIGNTAGPTAGTGTVDVDGNLLDNATVDFATTNSTVVEVANTSTVTDQGDFSEMLIPRSGGTATIFAASGDDVDRLQVEVISQGGGETMASRSEITSAETTNGVGSIVDFTIGTSGSEDVVITGLSVDYAAGTSGDASRINNGGGREIDFSSAGFFNAGGGQSFLVLGDEVNFEADGSGGANEIVTGGETTTGTLAEFQADGPGNSGGPVDMGGETLEISLVFGDGSRDTYTINVS